ncbi:MAG: ribosome assembly RNA-binding protein YhbY [Desulfobulbaceae bacterium]|nr:ribosome assembly RNA-binding protein YhbY [Desulfobulbaceae bacterium]
MDTSNNVLSGKQKKYLKALAHPLNPVVWLGKDGLSDQAIATTSLELTRHELIKVKLGGNSGLGKEIATTLADATGSHLVQMIGKVIVLYKENPKRQRDQRIRLPND